MIHALAVTLLLALPSARAANSPSTSAGACRPQRVAKHARLRFPGGRMIRVDVADTPRTREIGLMCRKALPRDYGMLFVFPSEQPLNFWMKKTLVALDIVWIGADKRVTVIHDRMKKSEVDTPDDRVAVAGGRGQYVLELPAGDAARRGLKVGDRLRFSVAIPKR